MGHFGIYLGIFGHIGPIWAHMGHFTLLHFAPCMDMHGFTLVYIYIYIYIYIPVNPLPGVETDVLPVDCLAGWLVGWLAGWLVVWLVGWLGGWLAGLAGWLV